MSLMLCVVWGCQPTTQQVILSGVEGEDANLCPSAPPPLPYLDGPDAKAPEEIASAIRGEDPGELQQMLEAKARGEAEAWVHLALGDVLWRSGDREGAAHQWRAGLEKSPLPSLQPSVYLALATIERNPHRQRLFLRLAAKMAGRSTHPGCTFESPSDSAPLVLDDAALEDITDHLHGALQVQLKALIKRSFTLGPETPQVGIGNDTVPVLLNHGSRHFPDAEGRAELLGEQTLAMLIESAALNDILKDEAAALLARQGTVVKVRIEDKRVVADLTSEALSQAMASAEATSTFGMIAGVADKLLDHLNTDPDYIKWDILKDTRYKKQVLEEGVDLWMLSNDAFFSSSNPEAWFKELKKTRANHHTVLGFAVEITDPTCSSRAVRQAALNQTMRLRWPPYSFTFPSLDEARRKAYGQLLGSCRVQRAKHPDFWFYAYAEGALLLRLGHFEPSLGPLKAALAKAPEGKPREHARTGLMDALGYGGELGALRELYEAAVADKKANFQVYFSLYMAHAQKSLSPKDFVELCHKAAERAPDVAVQYLLSAGKKAREANLPSAVPDLEKALADGTEYQAKQALSELAGLWTEKRETRAFETNLDTFVRRFGGDRELRRANAATSQFHKDKDIAVTLCQDAVAKATGQPARQSVLIKCSQLFKRHHVVKDAIEVYSELIADNTISDRENYESALSQVYLKAGRFEEATAFWRTRAKGGDLSQKARATLHLSEIAQARGQLRESLKLARAAYKYDRTLKTTARLGALTRDLGVPAKALPLLREALTIAFDTKKSRWSAIYELGYGCRHANNWKACVDWLADDTWLDLKTRCEVGSTLFNQISKTRVQGEAIRLFNWHEGACESTHRRLDPTYLLLHQGKVVEAYDKAIKDGGKPPTADLASALAERGHKDKALALLKKHGSERDMANFEARFGDHAAAEARLKKLVEADPSSFTAYVLRRAMLEQGRHKAAIAFFEKLAASSGQTSSDPGKTVTQILMDRHQWRAVAAIYEKIIADEGIDALVIHGRDAHTVFDKAGMPDKAMAICRAREGNVEMCIIRTLISAGKRDEAYQNALKFDAKLGQNRRFLNLASHLAWQAGDLEQAISWRRRLMANAPTRDSNRRKLAEMLLLAGKPKEAFALIKARADEEPSFALSVEVTLKQLGKTRELEQWRKKIAKTPMLPWKRMGTAPPSDPGQALRLIEAWIAKHPTDPDAYKALSRHHEAQGNLTKAIEAQRRALTLPFLDNPRDRRRLAMLYAKAGDPAQAMKVHKEGLTGGGYLIDQYRLMAKTADELGQCSVRVDALKKAHAQKPGVQSHAGRLRDALVQSGRFDEARQLLDASIETSRNPNDAIQFLALHLSWSGDKAAALDTLDRVLAQEPNNHRVLALRAEILQNLGRHEDAIKARGRTLALYFSFDYLADEINALSRAGRFKEAEQALQAANKITNHHTHTQVLLADARLALRQKDPKRALARLAKAHDTDPKDLSVLVLFVSTLHAQRDPRTAAFTKKLLALTEANTKENPCNPGKAMQHAIALAQFGGDPTGGLKIARKSAATSPTPWVLSGLTEVLSHAGMHKEALDAVGRALASRKSPDADDHFLHARILTALGRSDEAKAAFERGLALEPHPLPPSLH